MREQVGNETGIGGGFTAPLPHPAEAGVWHPIELADKGKSYDLLITDGKGWRCRVTDCFWRKGGRHGKAGWCSGSPALEGDEPAPVCFIDSIRVTHFLEVPGFPA